MPPDRKNPSSPVNPLKLDVTEEVRFAVVMYGGISLAIYMNGIAQELLHLVRSTSPETGGGDTSRTNLSPTEKVYRKLGQMLVSGEALPDVPSDDSTEPIRTRFIIDILSGSSAGGINAVFLAKALANDQQLTKLKELWVSQGDIAKLLNDKGAAEGNNLKPQSPPVSLLSGQRIYLELVKALEGMDSEGKAGAEPGTANLAAAPSAASPNVEELDLFVTATDMRGEPVELQLADGRVTERRHRNLFHFSYSVFESDATHPPRNDFVRENNPFLAFAARCTSAHPAAFNPMTLGDIAPVLASSSEFADLPHAPAFAGWQKFYADYLRERPDKTREDLIREFLTRNFNDGGVLDNQPFGPTLDTLPLHFADKPVTRKLVYIEPAPEHIGPQQDQDERPDFVENAWLSLSTLPRYEPIRQHLQKVLERNRLVERIQHITEGLEQDVKVGRSRVGRTPPPTPEQFMNADIVDMIGERGEVWGGYLRLRVAEVTDDLTLLVARLAGFDERSDEFQAIRYVVRYWRMAHYSPYRREHLRPEDQKHARSLGVQHTDTENLFLMRYDLAWRLRRLRFVLNKIDDMACFDDRGEEILQSAEEPEAGRFAPYPRLRQGANGEDEAGRRQTLAAQSEFRRALIELKTDLNAVYKSLRIRQQQVWSGGLAEARDTVDGPGLDALEKEFDESPEAASEWLDVNLKRRAGGRRRTDARAATLLALVERKIKELSFNRGDLISLLDKYTSEEQRDEKIASIVDGIGDKKFKSFADALALSLGDAMAEANDACEKILHINEDAAPPAEGAVAAPLGAGETVLRAVRHYYSYFDNYDVIAHPILYATDAGDEIDSIEVFRVSPEDATAIIDENKVGKRKLAGTKLSNFGAFFKEGFRVNDILWGRLDGAERIICALLPGPKEEVVKKRKELIRQAHHAIITEELGVEDASELLEHLSRLSRDGQQTLSRNLKDERVQFALGTYLTKRDAVCYFRDQFLQNYDSAFSFDNQEMLVDAARGSKVFGKMLEGYADKHQIKDKRLAWIARVTQLFYGLVEVAVPDSIPNLVFRYWLQLLYLFEFLTVLFGMLLLNPTLQHFGLLAFALTVALNGVELLLQDFMKGRRRGLHILVAAVAVVLVVLGGAFAASLESESAWNLLVRFRGWYAERTPLGWNLKTLARTLVTLLVLAFFIRAVVKGRPGGTDET